MRPSLILAAAATLGATAWTYLQDRSEITVVEPAAPAREKPKVAVAARGDPDRWLIERASWTAAVADPFMPKPPPPPPPVAYVAPPPPRPTAPPFPFKYFGRTTSPDGVEAVYLTEADRLIPIAKDDKLDGTYQVESISNTQIVIVYLPLGEKTVLMTPATPTNP